MAKAGTPVVCGLDTASRKFHLFATEQKYNVELTLSDKLPVDEARVKIAHIAAIAFMRLPSGSHIFCEEPIAGKNGGTTRILSLAAGAIWAQHIAWDLWWHWVDIAHWKKVVLQKGNADKAYIKEWARANGCRPQKEDDSYDAFCLMRCGQIELAAALGES